MKHDKILLVDDSPKISSAMLRELSRLEAVAKGDREAASDSSGLLSRSASDEQQKPLVSSAVVEAKDEPPAVTYIELWPHESECVACGKTILGCKTGIPMYEGEPVPHAYIGEWAGFDACKNCYLEYEVAQASPQMLAQWWKNVRTKKAGGAAPSGQRACLDNDGAMARREPDNRKKNT